MHHTVTDGQQRVLRLPLIPRSTPTPRIQRLSFSLSFPFDRPTLNTVLANQASPSSTADTREFRTGHVSSQRRVVNRSRKSTSASSRRRVIVAPYVSVCIRAHACTLRAGGGEDGGSDGERKKKRKGRKKERERDREKRVLGESKDRNQNNFDEFNSPRCRHSEAWLCRVTCSPIVTNEREVRRRFVIAPVLNTIQQRDHRDYTGLFFFKRASILRRETAAATMCLRVSTRRASERRGGNREEGRAGKFETARTRRAR